MKKRYRPILFYISLKYFIDMVYAVSTLGAQRTSNITVPFQESASMFGVPISLWEKIIIALVSAILAFLGAFMLERYKRKREPRKQISYKRVFHKGIVSVDNEISEATKVLYKGQELRNPYRLGFNFDNSGNTVIKNQYFRLRFPEGCIVVDLYFDPMPEPEIGFEETNDSSVEPNERKFKISHFEVGQSLGLRFILSGTPNKDVELHPYNPEGDVHIVEHSTAEALTDKDKISKFVLLLLLMWVLPKLVYIVPLGAISSLSAGIIRFVIAITMIPLLPTVVRLISDIAVGAPTNSRAGMSRSIDQIEKGATLNMALDDRNDVR